MIDGLGGSYGEERLTFYRMLPQMGPPETTVFNYPGEDQSWRTEFEDFVAAVNDGRRPCGDIADAVANLAIVDEIYRKVPSMIIVRSPLRITLGGGGTDLPSYYREQGGFLIAAAIDKYVYITVHQTFIDDLIVKYSELERVGSIDELKHPIIREAFKVVGLDMHSLEITSMADIPAGTGLGSSGSFTTALLKALYSHRKMLIHPRDLAEQACDIEINRLREPIGKQDQYIAAFGGLTCFRFNKDDSVEAWPLKIDTETLYNLEDNLLLFFTGYSRSASSILKEQDDKTKQQNSDMIQNLQLREGPWPAQSRGAGRRPPPRVRQVDARTLGAQEEALRRNVQSRRSTIGTITQWRTERPAES